jgi:hypothetical protein
LRYWAARLLQAPADWAVTMGRTDAEEQAAAAEPARSNSPGKLLLLFFLFTRFQKYFNYFLNQNKIK